ncbi:MAG TPA: hypothetical protein VIJ41_12700 [Candidatus Nanopelagicales bacterium]
MSIDDLARSAAQDLRDTAAGTFDVNGGLARIPVSSRRRTIAQQGSVLAMIVLVLIVGALAVRPHLGAAPQPVDSRTLTPSVSGPTPVPPPTGPFDVMVLRGTTLVVLDGSGAVRWSRDLKGSGLIAANLPSTYVSTAGWLSTDNPGPHFQTSMAGDSMSLLDLQHPSTPPRTIEGYVDKQAWSPDGQLLFVMMATVDNPQGRSVVIDPATGSMRTLSLSRPPGGGPDPVWAADSTGLLYMDESNRPSAVTPIDGSPLRPGVPALWFRSSRYIAAGGSWIAQGACNPCGPRETEAGDSQTLRVSDSGGTATTWYAHDLAPLRLVDTSLTADGNAAWLLLTNTTGAPAVTLARADATRHTRAISSTPVDSPPSNGWGIIANSPDDAMLIAASVTSPDAAKTATFTVYVLHPDGSPGLHLDGSFVGWVPSSVVDQLP